MVMTNWEVDYPDPTDFMNSLFDTAQPPAGLAWHSTWTRYGDARYIHEMRRAFRVQLAGRAAAYKRVDEAMFRNSPPAAVYADVSGTPQIFSSRIGCKVFRPQDQYGLVDLAALCIRSKS
jgi:hypothetical protein